MRLPLDLFYTSMAATVGTALPLPRVLASAGRPDLAPLADGRPLADILAAGGLPELDVAAVRAAEASGRLEQAFRTLARRAREAEILRRRIRAIVIYPMFIVHGVVIAPWVVQWIFATASFPVLLADLAAIWILFFAVRALLNSRFSEHLPVAGPIRREIACARFCDSLSGALDAAIPHRRAIEMAAAAAGGSMEGRARAAAAGDLQRPLYQTLEGVLPVLSVEMLRVGEESGSADKALAKLAQRHFEDATHALNKVVAILPVVLFLVAVGFAVLQIVALGGMPTPRLPE